MFVFVTHITHKVQNQYKLSLYFHFVEFSYRIPHGGAIKHAGDLLKWHFPLAKFWAKFTFMFGGWGSLRHLFTTPCILFLNCLYINNKGAARGGELETGATPPPCTKSPSPLFPRLHYERRRVSLLKICFYVCARLYFPISFGYCPGYVRIRLQNRENL